MDRFILAVDYDGTLIQNNWPNRGEFVIPVVNKVKEFKKYGAEIILWTCREGKVLQEAVRRCKNEVGLKFDAVNDNVKAQKKYMREQKRIGILLSLRKIYADFYVDDKARNIEIFLALNAKDLCDRVNDLR